MGGSLYLWMMLQQQSQPTPKPQATCCVQQHRAGVKFIHHMPVVQETSAYWCVLTPAGSYFVIDKPKSCPCGDGCQCGPNCQCGK
jgi:hypothetical protein